MFSRWMPPTPADAPSPRSRALLAMLLLSASWAVWYLLHHPVGILVGGGFVLSVWLTGRLLDHRLTQRARARHG